MKTMTNKKTELKKIRTAVKCKASFNKYYKYYYNIQHTCIINNIVSIIICVCDFGSSLCGNGKRRIMFNVYIYRESGKKYCKCNNGSACNDFCTIW